ncbi:MAG: hypothetical protein LC803_14290 [Acidobacteria bacterium]|nr:hypothetical protein [Acidobacteriota bacterium]
MMPVKREPLGEGRSEGDAPDLRGAIVCALLVALFVGVRLWRLDASCLWFDEVFSVHAARHGWGELLEFVALDLIHPPLFYLLLKVWMAVVGGGESVWWLRLFPLLTQAAAIVPLLLLGRELGLRRGGVMRVALLLLAVNGYLIQHAQGLRMYSLLLLFALCSLWLFARFSDAEARRRGDVLALFAVNLLLVYTHYFGWLLVGLEGLFVVIWRRGKLKPFVVSLVALGVCFSPWMWLVLRAAEAGEGLLAQNIGWQARPRLTDIFHPFLLLHEPFRFRRNTYEPLVLRVDVWLTVALFVPPFLALGWRAVRRRRVGAQLSGDETAREEAAGSDAGGLATAAAAAAAGAGREAGRMSGLTFLLFFSLAPVVVAFVLGRALPQSIWGTRHLIIIAPVYLLLASVALVSLRRPVWLAVSIKLLLACWLTLAATLWLMRPNAPPVWCAWETLAQRVVEAGANAAGEVRIYAAEDLVAYHLWYGMSSTGDKRFRVTAVKNLPGLLEDRAYFLPRGFDEVAAADASTAMREERFWVAFRDTSWNTEHPLLRLLAERGYDVEPRFEVAASGQKAFLVLAKRRSL